MLSAVTLFAVMNLCVKALPNVPLMEIVLIRCFISMGISLFWLEKLALSPWGKRENLWRLVCRGISGCLGLYLFFLTLQQMPLAIAVTVQYLSPIFTAMLAMFFLGEKLRPVQWSFFALSFAGAVLLKGFDDRVSWLYLGIGVVSAFLAGVAYNFVRGLSGREHPLVVVFYFQLVGVAMGGAFTVFDFYLPTWQEWGVLLVVGVTAHLAQVLLTKAIQSERVGIITSLVYLGAVYAAGFGWVFFEEAVTWANVFAMTLIITGILLNIWTNNKIQIKKE